MKFVVVVEEDEGAYGATSPDFPNIFAVGTSVESAISNFREGAEHWIRMKREDGEELPMARHIATTVDVEVDDVA